MTQARNIRDAIQPDEVFFVIDAMIGQDAVTTAEAFRDGVDFTGVVLTKLDGDARGGAALSIREVTGKPIMFASTGEKMTDFDVFHPDRMANRILGMGDVLTLIEQAEKSLDQEQALETASKLSTGELTLEDFLNQMLMIRKMGPIANLLKMLPGGSQMSAMADMIGAGDYSGHDAAGAQQSEDFECVAPAADRQRFRGDGDGGQPTHRTVLRSEENDGADGEPDGSRWWAERHEEEAQGSEGQER